MFTVAYTNTALGLNMQFYSTHGARYPAKKPCLHSPAGTPEHLLQVVRQLGAPPIALAGRIECDKQPCCWVNLHLLAHEAYLSSTLLQCSLQQHTSRTWRVRGIIVPCLPLRQLHCVPRCAHNISGFLQTAALCCFTCLTCARLLAAAHRYGLHLLADSLSG
jgi:hypothetical protein